MLRRISVFCLVLTMFLSFFPVVSIANDFQIIAAGATFPYVLYSKMFSEYEKNTGVKINYQGIGSGGGIRQLFANTVDFGGTDSFLSDDQIKTADCNILHIPTCLGAVAVTYNLPGNPDLRFTPALLQAIFMGEIKKWNDPRVKAINPGVNLPSNNIVVVYRSDGSGTTNIFTDYLSKVNDVWKNKIGAGTSVKWPVGVGQKGNPGVAGMVKQISGSIGYVELIYALQNNLSVGAIRNKSGNFIKPSLSSTSLAAQGSIPDDTRVSITDSDIAEAYPVAGFTWIILHEDQGITGKTETKVKTIANLLKWMVTDGQVFTEPLHFAPLPEEARKKALKLIEKINYNGKSIW